MENCSKNFQRFDQSRPRPIEVLIPISQVDSATSHSAELLPFRPIGEPMHFGLSAGGIPATRHHDDYLRIGLDKLFPTHPRRVLARFAEQIHSASHLDQF